MFKDFMWNVPQQNGRFQPIGIEVLHNALRLIEELDVVFVAIRDPNDIRLMVLDSCYVYIYFVIINESKRYYTKL